MAEEQEVDAQKGLDILLAETYKGVADALQNVALDVASIASTSEAPVREGRLRASTNALTEVKIAQVKGSVELSTGVLSSETYALIQHERTDFNHPKGGKDHFLTDPLKRGEAKYVGFVAAAAE